MDKTGSKQTCGSTRTIRRCRTFYAAEDKVLVSFPESIENHDYLHKVVLGVQSTEAVKKVKAYDSTIKVLDFLPDVESISAFGETQADAIRLIE